mmetsp:Transcript_31588/g.50979  ORF Transcript_31588/g.50979 Transcript_31588/m.50979 type:complete len:110 (-) Transcript_31588:1139-1468(-)
MIHRSPFLANERRNTFQAFSFQKIVTSDLNIACRPAGSHFVIFLKVKATTNPAAATTEPHSATLFQSFAATAPLSVVSSAGGRRGRMVAMYCMGSIVYGLGYPNSSAAW